MKNTLLALLIFSFSNIFAQDQNIRYSKFRYAEIENGYNEIGNNSHTAVKPFIQRETDNYYSSDIYNSLLDNEYKNWFARKTFDENLLRVDDDDYWFTLDPVVDFQIGTDNASDEKSTFYNTRGVYIKGELGESFSFQSAFYESQAIFPDYVTNWINTSRDRKDPAIVPGLGLAKRFKDNGFDFPMAEGVISFTPNKFFNLQFGTGKNFIGDGYRSLFLSDGAFNYPYAKINTTFWNIKYTNYFMWMQDIRPEVAISGEVHQKKFATAHYLSWNITDRINISVFESIVWSDTTGTRGFDINYINPVIFYRPVEFSIGSSGGNAMLGASTKIKLSNSIQFYGQLALDEFTLKEVKANNGYWANKFAFQTGLNYYNAFGIENLQLKSEINWVNPYTYSHGDVLQNYGHFNQPIAHPWGANFWESVSLIRYRYNRFFIDSKLIIGEKGYDSVNDDGTVTNWGGDIYRSYREREQNYGNEIGQGNTGTLMYLGLKSGYIVNHLTNLKLFVDFTYRKFDILQEQTYLKNSNDYMISVGMRTDILNKYFDF
ncbi:MAG: gliding motility protein RemB [Ichthyobacteriaceae bacterium]|nr:gliding motility protein RemB [Ichthyobacteriaceae bacterium]